MLRGLLNEEPVNIRAWSGRALGVVLGGRLAQGEHNTFFKVFEELDMDMSLDSSWKVQKPEATGRWKGHSGSSLGGPHREWAAQHRKPPSE